MLTGRTAPTGHRLRLKSYLTTSAKQEFRILNAPNSHRRPPTATSPAHPRLTDDLSVYSPVVSGSFRT